MIEVHKVVFSVGYDAQTLTLTVPVEPLGNVSMTLGFAYQVVDNGSQVGLFDTTGARIELPAMHSFDFIELNVFPPFDVNSLGA